jgi:hypothetical protein
LSPGRPSVRVCRWYRPVAARPGGPPLLRCSPASGGPR